MDEKDRHVRHSHWQAWLHTVKPRCFGKAMLKNRRQVQASSSRSGVLRCAMIPKTTSSGTSSKAFLPSAMGTEAGCRRGGPCDSGGGDAATAIEASGELLNCGGEDDSIDVDSISGLAALGCCTLMCTPSSCTASSSV